MYSAAYTHSIQADEHQYLGTINEPHDIILYRVTAHVARNPRMNGRNGDEERISDHSGYDAVDPHGRHEEDCREVTW